jgi:serine/threonine protein kinase
MTSIDFNCPNCGLELSADKTLSDSITLCPSCEQAIRVPLFNLNPGMTLGDFILLRKIGNGGMGEVWLAEQKSMCREIALKILSPELAKNEDFCKRFELEARNSGRLVHPNIVTAFYAGVDQGIHYLAMSYVEGCTLEEKLPDYPNRIMPEAQLLAIIPEIAEALKYGWDKFKLIHRDIKPSNIMLCNDGSAKLLDMGISKSIMEGDSAVTRTGLFVGTPYYISPEQAKNSSNLDCRADIYSLGTVIYHMLTGNVPYDATTPMGVVAMHLSEPLPDIRKLNPEASREIIALTRKMMHKNPESRFQTWDEVLIRVKEISNPPGAHVKLARFPERFIGKKNYIIVYICIATIAIILTLAIVSNRLYSKPTIIKSDQDNELEDIPSMAIDANAETAPPSPAPAQVSTPEKESNTLQQVDESFIDFFAGRAHLSAKEKQAFRDILISTRRKQLKLLKSFKSNEISRNEMRDKYYELKQEERRALRGILSDEQIAAYGKWDNDRYDRLNGRLD